VREPLLRQGIALLAPDVVALQEVDSGPGTENQAEQLLAPLGYQVIYEQREGEAVADPGIAVASRYPVADRRLIELPHGGAAVAARLETETHQV
jgi:endonuclease/exonuclease/phosphatase family metal-dependent hydrolase